MPTIEELPDDVPAGSAAVADEQLRGQPSTGQRGGISEELAQKLMQQMQTGPDAATESWLPGKSGKTVDEALKSFDNVPLFMKDLPAAGEDGDGAEGSNATMDALRSLAFSGTPNEQAANFKNHGNDYFRGKRYREAIGFYDKAIDAEPDNEDNLLLSLYLNRAACHLELHNYRSTLRDTSKALGLDPKSSKAFYRAAKALLSLGKLVEAIDCCDHALANDQSNKEVESLKTTIIRKAEQLERTEREGKERERRKRELDTALKKAFLARGLWISVSPRPPAESVDPHFSQDRLPAASSSAYPLSSTDWVPPDVIRTPIVFPVMLLYPQYAQSDFIQDFHEDTAVGDHLDAMFPPESRGSLPWDQKGEYISPNLNVYATTHRMRLLKVGKGLTLRQICDQGAKEERGLDGKVHRDGIVLQDGMLSMVVLPKGGDAEAEWIARFKKDREAKREKGEL
ncbi:unnamed protein product [Parajaminaea phylloscopi]